MIGKAVKREATFHAGDQFGIFRPDFFAADNGRHGLAFEFPAEERAVLRFARGFFRA